MERQHFIGRLVISSDDDDAALASFHQYVLHMQKWRVIVTKAMGSEIFDDSL
jgi:hypothetical protein